MKALAPSPEFMQPIAETFLHSTAFQQRGNHVVFIAKKLHYADGVEKLGWSLNKHVMREVYITKEQFRNHKLKKEYEDFSKLDRYTVQESTKYRDVYEILFGNGNFLSDWQCKAKVVESPFVYNLSEPIEVFVKNKMGENCRSLIEQGKVTPAFVTQGFLDIETDTKHPDETITAISFIHETHLYVGYTGRLLKAPLEEFKEKYNKIVIPQIEEDIKNNKRCLNRLLLGQSRGEPPCKSLEEGIFNTDFQAFQTEKELLIWIFEKLRFHKTNFAKIWNMGYDIPRIEKACHRNHLDMAELVAPEDVQPMDRYFKFNKDTITALRKNPGPADYWHWCDMVSYTQFYCAMSAYRTATFGDGQKESYSLDFTLKDNGFTGKLSFQGLEGMEDISGLKWHQMMTDLHPAEYLCYNAYDSISAHLLECKRNALTGLLSQMNGFLMKDLPRMSGRLCCGVASFLLERNRAYGVMPKVITPPWDKFLDVSRKQWKPEKGEPVYAGGMVVDPALLGSVGLRPFKEFPNRPTLLIPYVSDMDYSRYYPSLQQIMNISKTTLLCTVLKFKLPAGKVSRHLSEGLPVSMVRNLYGLLPEPKLNGYRIGVEYFSLPDLAEVEDLILKEMSP